MPHDNRPVGVFDSGLGGLTVVAALKEALPQEDIIYLGDNARVPYGNKSPENIIRFGLENTEFLLSKGVKAVIVACNTVSAVALAQIRESQKSLPVLGVLEAGVGACLAEKPLRAVVIGTRATINSDAYRRMIHARDAGIIVNSVACPLFVPLAEEGITEGALVRQVIDHYIGSLLTEPPDLILLGCTHYPLLKSALRDYLPPSVKIVDSAIACASYAADYLKENGLAASPAKKGEYRYYVTDLAADFFAQAGRFLGQRLRHVEKISL
ncbi:MAG: glutamate racemase [Lentisphaerae bacterium GWF2_52_8]|nr:MAG: glutamate racemase [Lentisphaerae bacterium GWF2_52_8]